MRAVAVCCLLLASLSSLAETAYVTDLLRLGLHRAEDTSDAAFRTLESGQEMEILSRTRNYAQVRLPDGTQGYVKAAYLVSDKPAKLIVAESAGRIEELETELDSLRAAFAEPANTIAQLEAEADKTQQELIAATRLASESVDELARLEARQERYRYSLPYSWVAIAVVVCLIGGMLFGFWWFDYRSRRRHGGIRVY